MHSQFTNVNKMLYLHRIKINPCIHQVKNTADLPNRGQKEYRTCLPTANHTTKTSKGSLKFTNQLKAMNMAWKYHGAQVDSIYKLMYQSLTSSAKLNLFS